MAANLSACECLQQGQGLPGRKRPGAWKILKKMLRDPMASGGNFSICYEAVHDDGTLGFVKATDIGLLTRQSQQPFLVRVQQAIQEQQFERTVLEIAHGNNMDRVVYALDFGEIEVTHNGARDIIFYIVFDMAKGDARSQAFREHRAAFSWCLVALHNLSVAVRQLHAAKISHNDIKPSNFLIFERELQKLSDLGRATSEEIPGPWDGTRFCGDPNYSAPEFWYRHEMPKIGGRVIFDVRKASDLYMLGSMAFYLVAGGTLTGLTRANLRPEHSPENWKGTFEGVLPYVRDAFGNAMALFDAELPREPDGRFVKEAEELRVAVMQLADPDPTKRGYPIEAGANEDRYSVDRFVSLFDRLSRSFALRER